MTNKLYVIGNGFDRYHGISSGYDSFKEYVETKDNRLFETLEDFFNTTELWSDFEGTLAHLDVDSIIDRASDFLNSYSDDDWSEAYHHDYQNEIITCIELVTKKLKSYFAEWIFSIEIGNIWDVDLITIDKSSIFLSFNYTDTLQRLYNISEESIHYIHNKCTGNDSDLILGHGRDPIGMELPLPQAHDADEWDVRVAEGNEILNRYYWETYKDSNSVILDNQAFFSSISEVEKIVVIGHSLTEIDMKYFEEIVAKTKNAKPKWLVSFHETYDEPHHKNALTEIGVPPESITMIHTSQLSKDRNQLELF